MTSENDVSKFLGEMDRKVWKDPELVVVNLDQTLSTIPPGNDGNHVGS
jgi:hypothetical protein